ncbi:hypothetical protein Pst134EB_001242 [Puccinia striiformis f. sp. tritici]|nr:hypothetical protein Pst134EB_001242 [Puccinia striiformis f. sp. tritici]
MRIPGIAAHPSHKLAGKVENSFKRVHLSLWSALCARHLFPYPPAIAIYPKPRSDWVLSVETTFEADRSWTSIHLLRHPDLSTDVLYLLAHLFCQVQCSCSPYPHIERNDLVPVVSLHFLLSRDLSISITPLLIPPTCLLSEWVPQ